MLQPMRSREPLLRLPLMLTASAWTIENDEVKGSI